MKELSIEEKAKAYDVAIERAKSFIENGDETERTISESIFAGIMDVSEDENIRKELIECLKHNALGYSEQTRNKWFDWLEKQGVQKFVDKCKDCNNVKGCITCTDGDQYAHITEQKPTDKVEPKFKAGDWITNGIDFTFQVISIEDNNYLRSDDYFIDIETADKTFRLWTIQDAKDGDVLVTNNDDICIFDGTVEDGEYPFAYCGITKYGFEPYDRRLPFTHSNVHPATKEQRGLLFSKMKEAGYEWDGEKKELKKIEQKSDEDSCKISDDITTEENDMTEYNKGFECGKQRVLKYPEDYGLCKNLAWSEEDENMLQKALSTIRYALSIPADKEDDPCFAGSSTIAWLKSLKERMKGE